MKKIFCSCLIVMQAMLSAHAQSPDEVILGPFNYLQNINGIDVNLSATSYIKLVTIDNKIYLHNRVVGDLSDLQRKISAIVDTFTLPTDNCASYNPKNLVVGIPTKELIAREHDAVFSIGGSITVWSCLENPLPNSKVEWEIRNFGLFKTKVPVVKTWPGSPIKAIIATQPFDASLPLSVVKKDDNSVQINIGDPNIELNGQYSFITKGVLHIAGINVNDKAKDALGKAIDPEKLLFTVPADVQKYNPKIESAELNNGPGHLQLEINLSALVPAETLNELIKAILEKKH